MDTLDPRAAREALIRRNAAMGLDTGAPVQIARGKFAFADAHTEGHNGLEPFLVPPPADARDRDKIIRGYHREKLRRAGGLERKTPTGDAFIPAGVGWRRTRCPHALIGRA